MAANVSEQRERAERLQDLADDARAQAEAEEAALRDLRELAETLIRREALPRWGVRDYFEKKDELDAIVLADRTLSLSRP